MADAAGRVPLVLDGPDVREADPYELLVGYLDWYRETLTRKLAGLSDTQLRTPVEPFGWAPLGLVRHLGWVERRWLRWGFRRAGRGGVSARRRPAGMVGRRAR
ncbi:mycothiol transferase [Fodinicola feengrottensis]|uniref:mycothiol transferase n=1 Tax=Fodinicola feengrottensis TaxID=435914 RepID=UPI0024431AAA|nr:DUF664 domain-containing protein [Fodinicola feengrottensis]